MGNCQAAEAATVVIQHPEGKTQRLYWPTTAKEVMRSNPGHHVALVVTQCIVQGDQHDLRCTRTRLRLLKPKHMLLIGQVYRLIADQEAMAAIAARKHDILRRRRSESSMKKHQEIIDEDIRRTDQSEEISEGRRYQEINREAHRQKGASGSVTRTRQWHPALRSISEDGVRLE